MEYVFTCVHGVYDLLIPGSSNFHSEFVKQCNVFVLFIPRKLCGLPLPSFNSIPYYT